MCDFISWIEKGRGKDKQILFLTAGDIASKRGRETLEYCQREEDLIGHGAIRYFYNIKGGKEYECIDFSNPARFPKQIRKALVTGQFAGMSEFPEGLLIAPLDADYDAKRDALYADYKAKRAPLDADYEAKRAPLDADYDAKRDALYADYEAKRDALDADYKAKIAPLYADYKAKRDALDLQAWDLFLINDNRAEVWRDKNLGI